MVHPLLERQLRKLLKHHSGNDPTLTAFVEAVDQAYQRADEDRTLLERSIELSSFELRQRNEALQSRLAELQTTRDQLARSYSLLRSTLDSTADAIVVIGNDRQIRAHNRQFSRLWRPERPENLVGRSSLPLLSMLLRSVVNHEETLGRLKEISRNPSLKAQELLELKDGRYLEMTSIPQIQGEQIVGRVFSLHDVTEKRLDEETIRHQAYHDALTGLPNRLLMHDRLRHATSLGARSGRGVVLFFLDLDHFKSVNDRLGHNVGDQLLQEVTARLRSRLRDCDTICRLGGDEFTVILENIADDASWKTVATALIERLAQPFTIGGHEIWVTVSIGVSQFPRDAQTAEELIRHADMAMYEAKQLGRNRYSEFSSILQYETDRKAQIESHLRHAISRGEFHLVFQPKFALATMAPTGFEALLRFENATLGNVSPDEFIPVAEQCGLIVDIGQWVLEQACRQLRAWRDLGFEHITLSVNLSPQQFRHPDLLTDVRSMVTNSKVPPDCLELEITESSMMDDIDQAHQTLLALRHFGIALSIDDFGSGYSSMNYLKNLPVNYLKIDRTFVRELAQSKEDAAIVASMITLGHNLNLQVVAEGVEDQETIHLLQRLGCDIAQGFLLSRPIRAEDATRLLMQSRGPDSAPAPGPQTSPYRH